MIQAAIGVCILGIILSLWMCIALSIRIHRMGRRLGKPSDKVKRNGTEAVP